MTAVRGYQERLAAEPVIRDSDSLSRSIAVIVDETLRVERIVGDLLDLAKLEGAADSLDLQDVSVEGLFGRVVARHAPQAAAKDVIVSTTIAPDADIVYGDRFRLEQALQNLAANAIRHAPGGGRVELRAEVNGSGTAAVIDNGRASRRNTAFVFDRFLQGGRRAIGRHGRQRTRTLDRARHRRAPRRLGKRHERTERRYRL